MKSAVIVFPGSNCDRDAQVALRDAESTTVADSAYPITFAGNTSVTYGWILTLEGTVDSDIVRQALLSTCNDYPKHKCILTQDYPSYKRWFRCCWRYA